MKATLLAAEGGLLTARLPVDGEGDVVPVPPNSIPLLRSLKLFEQLSIHQTAIQQVEVIPTIAINRRRGGG